jgi:hypothetical protein
MPGRVAGATINETISNKPTVALPSHTSPYFYLQCKLWSIATEVASVYKYKVNVPILQRVPLALVEAKYRKLVACMDELGENRTRGGNCPAHALVL